jgi:hypothetical protein
MAVSSDKCVTCSSRARSHDLEIPPNLGLRLEPDGSFLSLPYWFCSVKCFQKAIGKYLNPRYDIDKKVEDDGEYDATFKRARQEYFDHMTGGIFYQLFNKFPHRTEMDCIHAHMNAFIESFRECQIDEIGAAQLELHKRLFAEWEHQTDERDAEIAKEAAKREAQDAKLAQEQEARNAEEEKWRPKPFDI